MNNMPLQWVIEQQPMFISALMFVMMDLTNEVCFVVLNTLQCTFFLSLSQTCMEQIEFSEACHS